jgi:hypothetical protein
MRRKQSKASSHEENGTAYTSFIMGCTPKAIMEVEQWAKSMMQLWEQRLDALSKALNVEKP